MANQSMTATSVEVQFKANLETDCNAFQKYSNTTQSTLHTRILETVKIVEIKRTSHQHDHNGVKTSQS